MNRGFCPTYAKVTSAKDKINIPIIKFEFLYTVWSISLFCANFFLFITNVIFDNNYEYGRVTYFEDRELEVEVVVDLENWILLYIPLVSATIP